MPETSQRRAVKNYRARLSERNLARFEVLGRASDRELIRSLARHLAAGGPESERLRETVDRSLAPQQARKGGILAAFRNSPLVGEDLFLERPFEFGRKIDL